MFANKAVHAVARILAVTVLLDKRERDIEMVEFCHYVMTINQAICSTILPRQKILDWFDGHKAEFAEALASDTDRSYKTEILEDITEPDLRKTVLAAICAISVSDYELPDEETAFIKLALDVWKSEMPTADDISLVVG